MCEPGGFFIDPVAAGRPRRRHPRPCRPCARPATARWSATPETLAIMGVRYGEGFAREAPGAGLWRDGSRSARSTSCFVPAGHVLGTAQIVLEHGGSRASSRGDYKRRPIRPARRSSRSRATSSSPRRPSACRCSAIPTRSSEIARLLHCAARRSRSAACWSAPMRSARPAGDHAAARARLRRADLPPRRAAALVRALRGAGRRSSATCGRRPAPTQGR